MNNSDYTLSRPVAVSIPAEEIDILLRERDGRCALVYLALQRTGGQPLRPGALGLSAAELRETMEKLVRLGLVRDGTKKEKKLLSAPDELPQYTSEELVRRVHEDVSFQSVCSHTEQFFGRKLTSAELRSLLGMQDYYGLPPAVLMELVSYMFAACRAEKGPGRCPTMRMLEKEAYIWAENELLTPELAEAYIERRQERQRQSVRLLEALGVFGRAPSPSEKKYLSGWLDMGFGPEAVAEAYDRTVISAGGLKWPYLNKILVSWDQQGLHALDEILAGDPRGGKRKAPAAQNAGGRRDDLVLAEQLFGGGNDGKE